jgi:glutaredoxin
VKRFFVLLIAVIFIFAFFKANFVFAKERVDIFLFSSATCPHCAKERIFLDELKKKYPEVNIKEYEILYHPENRKILKDYYEKYQVPSREQGMVPATFTPTKYFIGFNEKIGKDIENCVRECLDREATPSQTIKIPILGEVDLSKISLPALTAILGTLDGFNPCAMWILVVLISLLLPLRSRKKILLVGGTFIFAEGLLYFLLMSAWLNAFLALSYVFLLRTSIGIFGIIFGALRLRDFFTWKPGVCKVVDQKGGEKIINKIQNLLKPAAVPATIFGVIALAFSVNLIEFFCSAGFPTIYTKILSLQNLSTIQYYIYLVFYNLFYMLDDFIIVGIALITLSHFKFSDRYNRYSTLVAGLLIFILGLLLIFKPDLLMF